MRTFILTLVVLAGVLIIPAVHDGNSASGLASGAAVLDARSLDTPQVPAVNIEVNKGGGGRAWYANPLWIAIGALSLVVLVMLVVMAAKGGGTTVVKG